MSNYWRMAVNPKTKKMEKAMFLDDYFGHHIYGIQFMGDHHTYHQDEFVPSDFGEHCAPPSNIEEPKL